MSSSRFDHAGVWRLAGPLIVTNVSLAVLGLVDTAVVGHLPAPYYIGAVAIAGVVFDFLYWGVSFLRMGTTGVVAQIFGSGDGDRMRSSLLQSLILAIAISVVVLIAQVPIVELALRMLDGSEEVHANARRYFDVRIWGAPAVMGLMVVLGWLIGMQNARATLIISVFFNLINVVLDFVFVFALGMDVDGVALAAVIAEYSGLVLALFLLRRELRAYPGRWLREHILELASIKRFVLLNYNILIRTLCLIFAFAFFTSQGASQGDVVLAANAILMKYLLLMALGLDGLANAAEALVGRAIGAQNRPAFLKAVRTAAVWSVLFAGVFAAAFALGGNALARMMTNIDPVRTGVALYLPWLIVAPLVSVWCFFLDGVFLGATQGAAMRNTMAVATFGVFLPAWYVLQPWGNHGLWFAFMLMNGARGVGLGLMFLRLDRRRAFV